MTRRTAVWAAVVSSLLLSACGVGMPDSGPVHETTAGGSGQQEQPANIDPPRPKKGETPAEIVSDFLDAMTATPPIRTSVAREFLTKEAAASWQPTGMVIYGGVLSARGVNQVEAKLIDAHRTDARGAWLGPVPEDQSTVRFPMELENGKEWRISRPPPYLIVPQTWFEQRFRQVSLYFFDPSASLLVPEPVFVPRGSQFASTLVNGLLQGPPAELGEQDYLPPGLRSIVSVPVSAGGVAQVDLTSDSGTVSMPSSEQVELLVSQLAWTLRQDPTILRFRVTIDGRPLQLPGETEFSVEHGHDYAPYVAGSSTQLFGLKNGLMVGGSAQNLENVTGPFGQPGYALRTISPDLRAEQVAAVSTSGRELWLAPVKDSGDPTTLLTDGEDLLRPSWDFRGRLWEVDRRRAGAEVSYLLDGRPRVVDVPGISGMDVKDFLVSRDGSRLVAVVRRGPDDDAILVSRILSDGDGRVVQVLPAEEITDPVSPQGSIRDIAWRSPTSVAVLRPVSRSLFQVRSASVDGATDTDSLAVTIGAEVRRLVGTPVPGEPIYALAPGAIKDLAGPRDSEIGLDPGVTMLSYVG